ncbi:MAG: hypothetical protein ACI9QL_005027 [Candidatus Omnitrophota bacterium]|jgi:uncharacterized protein (TIGR02231 family)
MKAAALVVLFVTLFASLLRAQESTITAVTIFSDRAQVTRTLKVDLKPGVQKLSLKSLPAWLDRGSVRAAFEQREGVEILDVQIDKVYLAQAEDEEVKAAELALQELTDQLADLEDELLGLAERKAHVASITKFSMEKIPRDAATRDIPVQTYKDLVEFAASEGAAISKSSRELERKKRLLLPEQQVRQSRLAELQQKNHLEQVNITVTAKAEKAGANTLQVKYQLPGATWEPEHEVRLEAGNQVTLISYARVTQTTGEDWRNVALTLSTQSPGTAVNIPELESLLVGRSNAGRVLQQQGQEDSFNAANDYYISNSVSMNSIKGVQGGMAMRDYQGNWDRQQAVQAKVQQTFKELAQRGTTGLFVAEGSQTVRTDGNSIRMAIGSTQMTGKPSIVAAPEISLNATRTLDLQHDGALPLLPGKVGLFLDGSFIGTTEIAFVGSGESFALFAGLVDTVKISRVLDHEKSSIARGKRENKVKAYFNIEVENLSDEMLDIRMADRVPVSDDTAISVSYVRTSPKVEPDSDGLILWQVAIAPKQKQLLTLSYTVEYPVGYTAERSKLQAAPSNAVDQLFDLEARF